MIKSLNSGIKVKVVGYIVTGLSGKMNNHNFVSFVKSYDIFCLFETLLEQGYDDMLQIMFSEYELKVIPAVRRSIMGRVSGGMVVGYKKEVYKDTAKYIYLGKMKIISIYINDRPVAVVPVYLSSKAAEWDKELYGLWEALEMYGCDKDYILIADCNCWIADKQVLSQDLMGTYERINDNRVSKANIGNDKGRKFLELCEMFDLVVLNGRMNGDCMGELTFICGMGVSVIDLCCVEKIVGYHK